MSAPRWNDDFRIELDGAKATIAHMAEAMSWVSGHDRRGLDHLEEAMKACAERDAAEGRLQAVVRAAEIVVHDFDVNVRPDAGIERLRAALSAGAS